MGDRRADDALRIALRALAATLPLYSRSVVSYADELTQLKSEH
jgi:hypothetical protein